MGAVALQLSAYSPSPGDLKEGVGMPRTSNWAVSLVVMLCAPALASEDSRRHLIRRCVAGAILALMPNATVARAQTADPAEAWSRRVFIEATAMADYDRTDLGPAGPVLASGFGIGSRSWRRYSMRFEFDRPGEHIDLYQSPGLEHRWTSKTTSYAFLLGRLSEHPRKCRLWRCSASAP
jgi:hypothetical protein